MIRSQIEAAWRYCPWGMAVIAADGKASAVNRAYAEYLGRSPATLLGQSEADLDALVTRLPQDYRRVEVMRDDVRSIHFLGDASGFEMNAKHMANIAEMLREPLASIYGFAELLLTQNYDEETRQDLTATLLEQVEVMTNIINGKLDTRNREPQA